MNVNKKEKCCFCKGELMEDKKELEFKDRRYIGHLSCIDFLERKMKEDNRSLDL